MSYYYGYGKQHREKHDNIEKKVNDIEKKVETLLSATVFEINLKTAKKTFVTINNEKKLTKVQNGKYALSQNTNANGPTFGDDFMENKGTNYMNFVCPELQFSDVSIFVVSEATTTDCPGSWCYIIGNDNGNYDKFIAYKSYSFSKLTYGGGTLKKEYNCILPIAFSVTKKNILSCHWMLSGSCLYGNGVLLQQSNFLSNLKSIGAPFGSVFLNERFLSTLPDEILKGKIYGFKIVTGMLLSNDIIKIHQEMMKEYNIS